MADYVKVLKHETSISVCFYIEQDRIMALGDRLQAINENAYMNGYNWEALLLFYLRKQHPDILEDMGNDPEAGMYVAYYDLNAANEAKAEKLAGVIRELVEDETRLLDLVRANGDAIEWD